MTFRFGQFYECSEDGRTRQVMVLHASDDGEEALLRYIDTRVEELTKWSDDEMAASGGREMSMKKPRHTRQG
jgi:hypothetical protein